MDQVNLAIKIALAYTLLGIIGYGTFSLLKRLPLRIEIKFYILVVIVVFTILTEMLYMVLS